jgi:hypothetical protein
MENIVTNKILYLARCRPPIRDPCVDTDRTESTGFGHQVAGKLLKRNNNILVYLLGT